MRKTSRKGSNMVTTDAVQCINILNKVTIHSWQESRTSSHWSCLEQKRSQHAQREKNSQFRLFGSLSAGVDRRNLIEGATSKRRNGFVSHFNWWGRTRNELMQMCCLKEEVSKNILRLIARLTEGSTSEEFWEVRGDRGDLYPRLSDENVGWNHRPNIFVFCFCSKLRLHTDLQ